MKPEGKVPHVVDVHLGLRIRECRRLLGLSQEGLATACGITFQQVQKYEKGTNRVSGSMLWMIAQRLGAPVGWFYEGLGDHPELEDAAARQRREFCHGDLGRELIDAAIAAPAPVVLVATDLLAKVGQVVDSTALLAADGVRDTLRDIAMAGAILSPSDPEIEQEHRLLFGGEAMQ